ncbi:hypothetical protein QBC43DRAFT_326355 [Cladorrhinum sp. PSN259]|nr:hypothetical protein QBC43DRAFT_326355 [Cladorrhinum sp. PSN259]
MSGLELVGVLIGAVPILLDVLGGGRSATASWIAERVVTTLDVAQNDGPLAVALLLMLPDASPTLQRINAILRGPAQDVAAFRNALASNMNMAAVAGAIVAQIGITALALSGVERAHWTAAAFFVASLVFGLLSVYVSFIVQQELNSLVGQDQIVDWLSRPQRLNRGVTPNAEQELELPNRREASAISAIMLASPPGMLNLSLNTFLVGLGVYLGSVYTRDLIPEFGKGGSLGLLVFYLVAATIGTFLYTFPQLLKASERFRR